MQKFSRRIVLLFAIFAVGALALPPALWAQQAFSKSSLVIRTTEADHKFTIEIARTPGQMAQGLMYRRRMAADAGMLFLFPVPDRVTMWMKNTYIPLDMLFIDGTGWITGMAERTVPLSLEIIRSEKPVSAVLELNAGTVSRLGIRPGDRVIHPAFGK